MLDIRTCPTCGSKRIQRVRRGVTRTVGGKTYLVPGVDFHECPDCGEKLYGHEAMRKLESYRPKLKATA
jgi:YgiT-type zinc finger domain-containing protein